MKNQCLRLDSLVLLQFNIQNKHETLDEKKTRNILHRDRIIQEIFIGNYFRCIDAHFNCGKLIIFDAMKKIKSDEIKVCVVPLQ